MTRDVVNRGLLGLLAALVSVSCTGVPEGVAVVSGFELERYLGTWYELARLDHSFERGLSEVTATYTLREGGGVTVLNRGWDAAGGRWKSAEGRAFFVDRPDRGRLKVSFFGPFYGGYNVVALDQEGYQWSLVCGPDRSYLWILARSPELDVATRERLVATARDLGFAVDSLIWVEHGRRSG